MSKNAGQNENLELYKKDRTKLLEKMDLNGITHGDYDPMAYAIQVGRELGKVKEVFFSVARKLYAIRTAEPYNDFLLFSQKYAGLSPSQANFYAQTYHEAREIALSADQVNELGPKKVHALYQLAPPEAIQEFQENGTINNVNISKQTISELKEILTALNSKSQFDLEFEKEQNTAILQENKQLKKHVKMLKDQLLSTQGRLLEYPHESELLRVHRAMLEANRLLEAKPIENEVFRKMADGILKDIEDQFHYLLHNVRGLAHPEPYDDNNPDVQRIKKDPRFDWEKLNTTEETDEAQQN